MSTEGMRLAALYSIGCPNDEANRILTDFLRSGNATPDLEAILTHLQPFGHYFKISLRHKLGEPFSREVVESYWLGMSRTREGELILSGRDSHNSIVLRKIFRTIIGQKEKPSSEAVNLALGCLVYPARIAGLEDDRLVVESRRVQVARNSCGAGFPDLLSVCPEDEPRDSLSFLQLSKQVRERLEKGFIKKAGCGDWISVHIGIPRQKISPVQVRNLSRNLEDAFSFVSTAATASL